MRNDFRKGVCGTSPKSRLLSLFACLQTGQSYPSVRPQAEKIAVRKEDSCVFMN
jgi:hypothetical protein